MRAMHSAIRMGLIGEFNEQNKAHHAIPAAVYAVSDGKVETRWVSTDSVGNGNSLAEFDGLWCVPGMPYRSADGALAAITYARSHRIPFLGTSAGFQYALIEYARNVLGLAEADHQKTSPSTSMPMISRLACALLGVKARVRLTDGSLIRKAYRAGESIEEYHCSFGLNDRYRRLLESGHLYVSAVDDQNDVRAVELDGHPFFAATLFQPEMRAVSPLVRAFVHACERRRDSMVKAAS
jgi:CTP synthase (UTP-ammonia lyase)